MSRLTQDISIGCGLESHPPTRSNFAKRLPVYACWLALAVAASLLGAIAGSVGTALVWRSYLLRQPLEITLWTPAPEIPWPDLQGVFIWLAQK